MYVFYEQLYCGSPLIVIQRSGEAEIAIYICFKIGHTEGNLGLKCPCKYGTTFTEKSVPQLTLECSALQRFHKPIPYGRFSYFSGDYCGHVINACF